MVLFLINRWDTFFHERTGIQGCRIAGYMRIGFALTFLIDRVIQLINLDFFFSPQDGVMPYSVTRKNIELADWNQYSIFALFPESNEFVWIVACIGILQGVILLLGATKYLRFHLFGIYLSLMSFQNHNCLMWDGEDNMFRVWVILFLFFPLDHCTIYDGFGFGSSSSSVSSSWPMWPFRLFQIEMFVIYMGASLGKMGGPRWRNGSAIYFLSYGVGDYPGIYNPDFIFEYYGPLKLMTWSALLLESVCYITVWFPSMRKVSVCLMVAFHIGIDLTMSMHMFEWLSCLGWVVYLIQPPNTTDAETKTTTADKERKITKSTLGSFCKKTLINVFVAFFVFQIFLDSAPFDYIEKAVPKSHLPAYKKFKDKRDDLHMIIDTYLTPIGLSQGGDWGMYTDTTAVLEDFRIDAQLADGTQVDNIWRSPDWANMSNWKRKFLSRHVNFYGEISSVVDYPNEILHFMKLTSKPFLEQNKKSTVQTLTFVKVSNTHKYHRMESTGGFWDRVVRHPMDVSTEEKVLVLRVEDCQDALSVDTCKFVVEYSADPEHDDDILNDDTYEYQDEYEDDESSEEL